MGPSPAHSSTVPLILNLITHRITAQFHCVFDDWFSTVSTAIEDIPDYSSEAWQKLFGDSEYQYTFDDDDDGLFGPGDGFLFLGERNRGDYTDVSVYWLTLDEGPGLRMQQVSGLPDGLTTLEPVSRRRGSFQALISVAPRANAC